ncbi:MAG: ankyrin repeat domain-containing protein [Candidatus Sericytochromatia bacterium]
MDVWDLIETVKSDDLTDLRKALKAGVDPNLECEYTGMTALLWACEKNLLDAARLLLEAGADPDCMHADGYNCYDSSSSIAIKKSLVDHGFSLVVPYSEYSIFSAGYRLLSAAKPQTLEWQFPLKQEGTDFRLEYQLSEFPAPKGCLEIMVEPEIKKLLLAEAAPGHQSQDFHFDSALGLVLHVRVQGFSGDLRVRLYDLRGLDSKLAPLIAGPWPA